MSATKFEDLKVWKHSREFVQNIYNLTASDKFNRDYGLKDQLQRSSVSIMNNIAEGFERGSNKDFIRFLIFSKGSAAEVRSLLYVANDLGYITDEEFETNYNASINIITQLANFIKYLNNSEFK